MFSISLGQGAHTHMARSITGQHFNGQPEPSAMYWRTLRLSSPAMVIAVQAPE
jgi:hypothetical protein